MTWFYWWQVLGSNQRRLSRRFTGPPPQRRDQRERGSAQLYRRAFGVAVSFAIPDRHGVRRPERRPRLCMSRTSLPTLDGLERHAATTRGPTVSCALARVHRGRTACRPCTGDCASFRAGAAPAGAAGMRRNRVNSSIWHCVLATDSPATARIFSNSALLTVPGLATSRTPARSRCTSPLPRLEEMHIPSTALPLQATPSHSHRAGTGSGRRDWT